MEAYGSINDKLDALVRGVRFNYNENFFLNCLILLNFYKIIIESCFLKYYVKTTESFLIKECSLIRYIKIMESLCNFEVIYNKICDLVIVFVQAHSDLKWND